MPEIVLKNLDGIILFWTGESLDMSCKLGTSPDVGPGSGLWASVTNCNRLILLEPHKQTPEGSPLVKLAALNHIDKELVSKLH